MLSLKTRFRLPQPARLATLRATLRLLYTCHPRAFVTSSIASLFEPLFFPALLLLLHQLLQEVIGSGGTARFTSTVALIGLGLVVLVLAQRLGIILRDSSSTILRQQAWVVISKRIMQKLPTVPYPLFENNAFQARYGLVIREASQRSITLVDSLLSTAPIFLGLLGLAATLFVLAPLLVLAMVAISIPASLVERRFSGAMYELQENQKTALVDVSCDFRPGLTAIVGTNGAGKSTLVKLLTGLVPPTTGSLYATLATGEEVSLSACAKAVLFQDPSHFHFSIRQNVTMQSERVPGEEDRIAEVLRLAGLWEMVEALPDAMDTVVGAGFGGVSDLSGGQWQRLALARLLYHDAPLIILDEPTTSLDPVGERQIFELLTTFAKEKIILFTTHRYDTIRKADTIVVLVDGRIAEIGTHEELASHTREFWSLFLAQGSHPNP